MEKQKKHILICQDCLRTSSDKNMKRDMFYIVDSESHYTIQCIDCITENNLIIVRPYHKPRAKKER